MRCWLNGGRVQSNQGHTICLMLFWCVGVCYQFQPNGKIYNYFCWCWAQWLRKIGTEKIAWIIASVLWRWQSHFWQLSTSKYIKQKENFITRLTKSLQVIWSHLSRNKCFRGYNFSMTDRTADLLCCSSVISVNIQPFNISGLTITFRFMQVKSVCNKSTLSSKSQNFTSYYGS